MSDLRGNWLREAVSGGCVALVDIGRASGASIFPEAVEHTPARRAANLTVAMHSTALLELPGRSFRLMTVGPLCGALPWQWRDDGTQRRCESGESCGILMLAHREREAPERPRWVTATDRGWQARFARIPGISASVDLAESLTRG